MTTRKQGNAAQGSMASSIADLRSRDGMVRQKARKTLTTIGKRAVLPLLPLLNDPDDHVRWEAAKALADIADPGASSGLVTSLQDENGDVRWLAAEGLIAIGRDALVPLLETLIERSDSVWLRGGAHHVLHDMAKGELGDLLTPVVAALDGVDPEIGVRGPASKALEGLRG
jgi:HEAT repeat protein